MEFYRGDDFSFDFGTTFENKEDYVFQVGDIIKVGVKTRETQSRYELYKEIKITEATDTITISFTNKETKRVSAGDKLIEIELTQANGTVRTLFQDKLTVKGDVVNG